MRKLTIQIDKRLLLFFLLIFPHVKPRSIPYINAFVDNIYDAARLGTVIIIALIYFAKRKTPSRFSVLTVLFGLWITAVTFVNAGNVRETIIWAGSISAVALTVEYFGEEPYVIIKGLFLNLEWIVYANLYTVLRYYPKGLYSIYGDLPFYFLGNRNMFIEWVLPTIVTSMLFLKNGGSKLRVFTVIASGIYAIYKMWSATSLLMLGIFFIMLFMGAVQKKNIPAKLVVPAYLTADILITKLRVVGENRWVTWLIQDVLHKKPDMTGRQEIWQRVSQSLHGKRLLLGSGYYATGSPHNQIYAMLVFGGILALLLYSGILFDLMEKINRTRHGYVYVACVAGMTALLFGSITEDRWTATTFLTMSLCYTAAKYQDNFLTVISHDDAVIAGTPVMQIRR